MLSFRDAYLEKPDTKKIKIYFKNMYILEKKSLLTWVNSLNINDLVIEINKFLFMGFLY